MAKWIVGGLLALVVLAGGAALVNAHGRGGHEVRIEARRLDDGRIEFALRERGGERILPPARYFPAATEAGRWLSASWITVGAGDEFAATPPPAPSVWVPVSSTDALTGRRTTGVYSVATSWTNDSRLENTGPRYPAPRLHAICASPTRFKLLVDWGRVIIPTRDIATPAGAAADFGVFTVDGGRVQYFWWSVTPRGSLPLAARQQSVVENWEPDGAPLRQYGPPAYAEEFADAIRRGFDRIEIRLPVFDSEYLWAAFPIGGFAQAERAHLSCR